MYSETTGHTMAKDRSSKTQFSTLFIVTLLIGITSGLSGMLLALLLKWIQHVAYGYSPFELITNETFLQGVRASSPERRVLVLSICGLAAGCGWWLLYRFGKPLVSIADALKHNLGMPPMTTLSHALLQIITIALGSPLGRETAPREVGAVIAQRFCERANLAPKEARILLACGAGAGFAAIYNVPLGGALFTLEVLLCTLSWSTLLPALASSAIATMVARLGLGNEPQYYLTAYTVTPSLLLWAVFSGPIFGISAYTFVHFAQKARQSAPKNWQLPLTCLLNFFIIGVLAIYFPALLGNGKSPARLEFDNQIGITMSLILLILRYIITCSSLRAGSHGGLLTPSLANGALLAVVLGGCFNMVYPGTSMNAYAITGATAFLAAAQKMPVTAIVLMFEFTRIKPHFLPPMLLCVIGAVWGFRVTHRHFIIFGQYKN